MVTSRQNEYQSPAVCEAIPNSDLKYLISNRYINMKVRKIMFRNDKCEFLNQVFSKGFIELAQVLVEHLILKPIL